MTRKVLALMLVAILSAGIMTAAAQPKKEKSPAVVNLADSFFQRINYRAIGPTRQSGRFVDFAVPWQKPFTFYAATASGGLWKTVNNGITFEPIFDQEKVFSIGDIEVAPSNPEVI
ncbi:MAG: hypothetical protein QME69_01925 [Candidatus Saccharicenans sp.]|nr:hypothetical protein [Candidatus Saccharicenans sp.]